MKRLVYHYLVEWKNADQHKPLIIRGARQVGKTHIVRQLAKSFNHYVEINLERQTRLQEIFIKDLDPMRIIRDIALILGERIEPGKTLLFFDEIQAVPQAITALRYFFEEIPDLHVIAAGSLLDFVLENIGVPVGRVSFLHMYPMSFIEFLDATNNELLADEIMGHELDAPLTDLVHNRLLELLGIYMAVGGMPEAMQCWVDTHDIVACSKIHHELVNAYRQDFQKYAKKFQLKYVDLLFNAIPFLAGQNFKYSAVAKEYRKRELAPCLALLTKANIVHLIYHSAGNGIPIGAEANLEKFKTIFIDIGLCQAILGLDTKEWLLNYTQEFINKGALTESLIGQELLAYSAPYKQQDLYYWHKEDYGSSAEIDYLIQKHNQVVPIEVKSGHRGQLKSLQIFLSKKSETAYGIRLSTHNYSILDHIHSYPLYAVAKLVGLHYKLTKDATANFTKV